MNTQITCPHERAILFALREACAGQNGYAPHDSPALIIMLSNHRRNCPFCNGTALEQLFGKKVLIVEAQDGR